MQKLILLLFSLNFTQVAVSQECCKAVFSSTEGNMATFVQDKKFRDIHETPLSYKHKSKVGGKMIQFKTPDQSKANAYFIASKSKSDKWLFVFQEWWGLNDNIKKQADDFYQSLNGAVNVIALDMYDGKLATKPDDAGKYMREAKEERLEAIIKGAVNYAGKKAKITNVGWCFGGGLSLKAAILEGKQAVGCVMYYGMPIKDVEKLRQLNCDVLAHFATEEWISKTIIEEFAANMKTAGKSLNYSIYEAPHAFANPSNPKYNKPFAEDTYKKSVDYMRKKME